MKKHIPFGFNLNWIKSTSLKYNIINVNDVIYEYLFIFITLLIIFCFLCELSLLYYPLVSIRKVYQILIVCYIKLGLTAAVFFFNLLCSFINRRNFLSLTILEKNKKENVDEYIISILKSYYNLCFFVNIIICAVMVLLYLHVLISGYVFSFTYLFELIGKLKFYEIFIGLFK